jgi:dCMP deaminase
MNTDLYWMALAYEAAEKESNCNKRRVGACIVSKQGRRTATGANISEEGCTICNRKTCRAVHAEVTAIKRLPHDRYKVQESMRPMAIGGTIYITYQPCLNCAKAIIAAGIKRVVYDKESGDYSGTNFLKFNGIEVLWLEKYVKELPRWKTLAEMELNASPATAQNPFAK